MNIRRTLSLGVILIAGSFAGAVQAGHDRFSDLGDEVEEIELEGMRGFAGDGGRKYIFDEITGHYYFEEDGRRFWRDIEDGEVKRVDLDKDGDHERNIDVKVLRGFKEIDLDGDIEVRRYRGFREVELDDDFDDGRRPRWWRRMR